MKRFLLTYFLFAIAGLMLHGQVNPYGYPLYRYYNMKEYGGTEQNWAITKDSRGIIYIGNNDNGVLQYDGETWRQIPVPNTSIVRSLDTDENGVVYVGAVGEFGKLLPDESGQLQYHSLTHKLDTSENTNFSDVWKTYCIDSITYFCTSTIIFKYVNDTIISITLPQNSTFSHHLGHDIYVGSYYHGLDLMKNDSTFIPVDTAMLSQKNVFVLNKINNEKALLGTFSQGIYTMNLNNQNVMPVQCEKVNHYLKTNNLYHALVDNSHKAFATLNGGVLVARNYEPYEIYDQKAGLPSDQRVAYLYAENTTASPLWAGLNNGIIRIDWHLPLRVMDERNGLKGHITDIERFNGNLYVSTSSGLFKLYYKNHHPRFKNILKQKGEVWELMLYTYPHTKNKVLMIGTAKGLWELNSSGLLSQIEDRTEGIKKEREFYTYFVGVPNKNAPGEIALGERTGISILKNKAGNRWKLLKKHSFKVEIRSIVYYDSAYWCGTTFKGVIKLDNPQDTVRKFYGEKQGITAPTQNYVYVIDKSLYVINPQGILRYNKKEDRFETDQKIGHFADKNNMGAWNIASDKDNYYMNLFDDKKQCIIRMKKDGSYSKYDTTIFKRLPNVQFDAIYPEKGVVWFGSSKGLYAYIKNNKSDTIKSDFKCLIRKVTLGLDSVVFDGAYNDNNTITSTQPNEARIELQYKNNDIKFRYAAPFFEDEEKTDYSYFLKGYDDKWSNWTNKTEKEYTNLPAGDYIFMVKARNIYGEINKNSNTGKFYLKIQPPWYKTIWAIIGYFIVLAFFVRVIVQWRTRKLQKEKERLEEIVKQRTAEIVEKKEEIEKQRDEIAEKNQSITDSIHYASRIQQALLPSEKMLDNAVPEHFVLFKPRDIVSGDYYWMTQIKEKSVLVAADCTGHGVPGAFMSMLGMSFFNEIVNKNLVLDAGEILNQLRAHVIEALKQEGDNVKAKDGMDLALYIIDKETNTINFAGANNPLYIIREQTEEEKNAIAENDNSKLPKRAVFNETHILQEVKADKMPIGIHIKQKPFETKTVQIQKGMQLYTFSDGYVDQFGGPNRRKFMSKAFKKLLMQIHHKPMEEQRSILDKTFVDWIAEGNEIQVDDIVVLGVKII